MGLWGRTSLCHAAVAAMAGCGRPKFDQTVKGELDFGGERPLLKPAQTGRALL